jgi:putative flippase GtrA
MRGDAGQGPAALLHSPPVRFVLAGIVNTAVGLLVSFLALHAFGLSYWPATALGFAAGWIVGFGLSRRYVFRSRLPCRTALPRYALAVLAAYVLSAALARETSALFTQAAPPAAASASPLTDDFAVLFCNGYYAILNYAGQRWFVFRQ